MRRTSRFFKQLYQFLCANSRLFLFLALLLSGVIFGCSRYLRLPEQAATLVAYFSDRDGGFDGFFGALTAFFTHSLVSLVSVGLLMLSGMSLCGLPLTLILPFGYGVFLGLCEAAALQNGDVAALLLTLPEMLLCVWTMLVAGAESLRLTLRLVAQVMPGAQSGGLWRDFRLFFRRFLLCFLLMLLASAIGTTLAVMV